MGIEPTRPAWKAGILPLNYTRNKLLLYYSTTFLFCQGVFQKFLKKFFIPKSEKKRQKFLIFADCFLHIFHKTEYII